MEPFIKINGRPFPYPKRGLELVTSTFVDSARNTSGEVVGQKVGRDQYKINRCEWPVLNAEQWSMMLSMLNDFFVVVTFPDQVSGTWRSLKMYPGDRSAEPYFLDETTGLPRLYRNCRVNLIDAGYRDTNPPPVPPQYKLQKKTVVPTTEIQVVKPDSPAYYGLSEVVVGAAKPNPRLEPNRVEYLTNSGGIPNSHVYTIEPSSGFDAMSNVTVRATMGNQTVVPNRETQKIKPGVGEMGLSSVTVEPIDAKYKIVDSRVLTLDPNLFKPAPEGESKYASYYDISESVELTDAYIVPTENNLNTNAGLSFRSMGLYAEVLSDKRTLRITSIRKTISSNLSVKLVLIHQ